MKYTGRVSSILLVLAIQTAYVIYYLYRDGFVDPVGWFAYPVLLLISYWTGLQYDKANYYSEKDALTDLYNRRYIIKNYGKYQRLSSKKKKDLFMLLLDCNEFKQINDRHGHAAGDFVLRGIGSILLEKRPNVYCASRWGGDEFVIVGSCNVEREVRLLAEELKQRFEGLEIPGTANPVIISIGSAISGGPADIQELIQEADVQMYKNKR